MSGGFITCETQLVCFPRTWKDSVLQISQSSEALGTLLRRLMNEREGAGAAAYIPLSPCSQSVTAMRALTTAATASRLRSVVAGAVEHCSAIPCHSMLWRDVTLQFVLYFDIVFDVIACT